MLRKICVSAYRKIVIAKKTPAPQSGEGVLQMANMSF